MNNKFMQYAIDISLQDENEVPVGVVIVQNNKIIAESNNEIRAKNDPLAHAEIVAIRRAGTNICSYNLSNCDLYTTLEPCPMCAYAISLARIKRLYFAAYDKKRGAVYSNMNIFTKPYCFHCPEIYDGIMESETSAIMRKFFFKRRLD